MAGGTPISELRERVRRIESRGRGGETGPGASAVEAGWARLSRRALHEWFSPVSEPPLCVLSDLVGRALGGGGVVFWVGRDSWPHPRVLVRGSDRTVLERSVLVGATGGDRLWALNAVLRCEATAAVVADGRGLSLKHTRRLQLAAEAGRALVLLWRGWQERGERSVAMTRWAVEPARASSADAPRWTVRRWRSREAGETGREANTWTLEWRSDAGVVCVPAVVGERAAASRRAG